MVEKDTREIYFVRHGSTSNLEERRYQYPDTPLSEVGRMQGKRLIPYFRPKGIQLVMASKMLRAKETGALLSGGLKLPLIVAPDFHELMRPSQFWGRTRDDPEIAGLVRAVYAIFGTKDRVADEENFFDLRARGLRQFRLLEERAEDRIAVVTHRHNLRCLLSIVLYGPEVSPEEYEKLSNCMDIDNGGVCRFTFDPKSSRPWKVLSWNETAHLD